MSGIAACSDSSVEMPLLPSGSVEKTTKYRAALRSGDTANGMRGSGGCSRGPSTAATPGWVADRLLQPGELRRLRPDAELLEQYLRGGEDAVGEPSDAATAACLGSLEAGSPLMKSSPRPIDRRPEAATTRTATQTTTVPRAAARCVARWAIRARWRANQPGRPRPRLRDGQPARPVQGPAERGHHRGDEGDADDKAHQDADREARAEGPERRLRRGQERRRPGGDHEPRDRR